ncbi:MAG: quinone-dependent dihydroorotate dehydrogenase [Rhodospirillales bacterium]|nr:quinone-dependent dihydroorotate dehydrogenase [Rhodospirillales bacterium]
MADFYRLAGPLIRLLSPETGHRLAVLALRHGLIPGQPRPDDPVLASRVFGLDFPTPLGLAAGFDKNGEAIDALLRQGFGFVEVGTVTPRPQAGNPRPRLFRLTVDRGVINRMGFNNDGLEALVARLDARSRAGIVGVNLGKNRDSADAVADYEAGVRAFAGRASYLVVNVSSPNTPGLRALQGREPLHRLLSAVMALLRQRASARPPLLLKIAPDLTDEDKRDIAAVALETGIDGIIATNTSIARPASLRDPQRKEKGGLSGGPMFDLSTTVLREMYTLTKGALPLIGVGGVASGEDAYAKIRAGASLVQLYSALVYEGPALVGRIQRDLAALLRANGYTNVSQAVGADHR